MIGVLRTGFETEVWRRVVVPESPSAFIAKILRLDQTRPVATLGAIGTKHVGWTAKLIGAWILPDHHSKILCGLGICRVVGGTGALQRAAAHHSTAVRIPLLPECDHLPHVVGGDSAVARFP